MKKALENHGPFDTIPTNGFPSYRGAMRELGNQDRQEIGRWTNNRVENSHLFRHASLMAGEWPVSPADLKLQKISESC